MNSPINQPVVKKVQRWAWILTTVLALAMVVSVIDRFALSLLIEPIKKAYGITDSQIGLLQGLAFGLFYAVLGLPCGWLADKWSRKGTIVVGLLIWSAATAACGLTTTFVGLLASRMLVGAGEAALAPAAYAIIHDQFPRTMINRALSLFQVGAVIGAGTAFYIVGAMYDYLKGIGPVVTPWFGTLEPWQQTFVAVALPGLVLTPILWWVLSRAEDKSPVAMERGNAKAVAPQVGTGRYMWSDRTFIAALFIGMSGLLTMNYALLSWLPSIFAREFAWTPGQIGRPYGLIVLVASSLGMLIGGWAADRIQSSQPEVGVLRVPLTAAVIGLPFAAALLFTNTPMLLLGLAAVLHALCTCSIGVAPALIQLRTPALIRSRVSAVYVLAVNICGLAIGPLLVGEMTRLVPQGTEALRTSVAVVGAAALLISVAVLASYTLVARGRTAAAMS
ncbi:Sialic acid transporter NanT [Cupriavidus yeoncheonensis]|uniref:Sialic acid transporter NanT n=1 Tax=Cupriavidus yeoncheonensis TaxID=1462994 RepID=A0A916IYW3_9BURK|nr:MFS transporter [Cupriavidus yeoncheonensis]CAG2155185.1 Sialic acid transporter NanT [Cupriavidus yeoncheonensis]